MPECSKCGTPVDVSSSFCHNCGTNFKVTEQPATGQASMRDKGSNLEDSIASYFRRMGFDVEPRVRMKDRFDVSHEIDVLSSKKESFGTITVAAECKYVRTPTDIKEVRNFHDKLSALGITKGIFVSTGGFTTDARSHAEALGIELWDMNMLEARLSQLESPQADVIHDALSFGPTSVQLLSPRHLKNSHRLPMTARLQYRPYYFIDFHVFSQQTVGGNSVEIESRGTMVLDAVTGQVVDCVAFSGKQPSLPMVRSFVDCARMKSETRTTAELPHMFPVSVLRHSIDSARAKGICGIELIKALPLDYGYWVGKRYRSKKLRPRKKDVEILDIRLIKMPLLTGTYQLKNYTYTRTLLAPTGGIISDQTAFCVTCNKQAVLVCENCGGIACESHGKSCMICGKNLCKSCIISKGIISKKYYCEQHQPQD